MSRVHISSVWYLDVSRVARVCALFVVGFCFLDQIRIHVYQLLDLYIKESRHTYKRVTSHILNKSRHTYK